MRSMIEKPQRNNFCPICLFSFLCVPKNKGVKILIIREVNGKPG